uniref:Urotensin 2 n=1 Tax=Junco hyemalis TaxID=40217 RepID=A0A8C5JKF2_JUNHY
MHKVILCCLIIICFSCPLLSLPIINASEMSYQHSADEDSRLNLERLGSSSLLQLLPELLGTLSEDSKAGEHSHSNGSNFYRNHPQNAFLGRLLTKDRKQYKKRGNLSECFWKYCV